MKKSVLLCGTGTRLGHMTLETAEALRRCERVLCVNLPEELFRDVRRKFERAEALDFADSLEEALCASARAWFSTRARPGAELGVLFVGHPLIYSSAPALIEQCRRLRRPYRVFPGVSAGDVALAVAESALSGRQFDSYGTGLVVRSAQQLLARRARLDPRSAIVLLNLFQLRPGSARRAGSWLRLVDHLERFFPPGHPAILLWGSHDGAPDVKRASTVRGLRKLALPIDSRAALFIPMRRS